MRINWLAIALCLAPTLTYATDYTTQVTASAGQTITLNPGDTITISATTPNIFGAAAIGIAANLNLPGVVIKTADSGGFGISATGGGTLSLTNGTSVSTTNSGATGINTSGATMSASNISVLTTGISANGIRDTNTPLTISNSSIQTTGISSITIIESGITARFNGSNLQILATGSSSSGLSISGSSQLNITNSTISVGGSGSTGAAVASNSSMTLSSATLATTGANSIGLSSQSGGNLTLTNTTVTTAGNGATGLVMTNGSSTIAMTGGSILTQQGDAIAANGATANLSLKNNTTITGGSGNLLTAVSSNTNLTANNNVTLNGNISADNASVVNMSLLNNSIWTGGAINLTSLMLDPSTWDITSSSTISGTLTNGGIINFAPPQNGVFKTLTVGNYVGQNGVINLNGRLGGDNSPTDSLVINGGNASGTTTLNVTNIAGLGDITQANGILLVNAINGGTINPNAFVLGNKVIVGAYQYTLFQGGAGDTNNFFLRSVIYDPSTPKGGSFVPNYRSEVSLYAALPTMEMLYTRTLLDTLHQRVGNEELLSGKEHVNGWIRVINQGGNINNNSIFDNGPNFNYHFLALQAGYDIYHQLQVDGSRDYAGFYGAAGNGNGNVEHFTGENAGNNRFNALGAGFYWTHFGSNNWYVDSQIQGNWLDANSRGLNANIKPHSVDYSASVESGYPFTLAKSLVIEPQAQLVYQNLSLDKARDGLNNIQFADSNALAGRLGLQLANTWLMKNSAAITGWVRMSEWHESSGISTTKFDAQSGFIPFTSQLPANWAQADIGVTGQASKNVSVYGTLSREIYFSNRGKSYNAMLGFRVNLC